jgi:hypothetical protein
LRGRDWTRPGGCAGRTAAPSSWGRQTVVLVPAERLGIVVFTNGMPIGIPKAIAAEVLDLAETGAVNRD